MNILPKICKITNISLEKNNIYIYNRKEIKTEIFYKNLCFKRE